MKSTFITEVLEGCDHGARLQVLADINLRNAGDAGERRLQRLLIDRRLETGHARAGGRQLRLRLIVGHLGARAAGAQRRRALQVRLVQSRRRLHIEEVGPLHRVIELNQDLALAELLVGLEIDFPDDAAGLHGELDAIYRPCLPIALMPGVHSRVFTSTADTACAGGFIVAKNSAII